MLELLSVSVYFNASADAGVKRKKKNALGLALAFMLTSACFHVMCCFSCAYAYVRACVTSENKAFMLVLIPGLHF